MKAYNAKTPNHAIINACAQGQSITSAVGSGV